MKTEPQPVTMPALVIKPKISGQGVVYKKDGTVSKPEPKEQDHGSNPHDRSA